AFRPACAAIHDAAGERRSEPSPATHRRRLRQAANAAKRLGRLTEGGRSPTAVFLLAMPPSAIAADPLSGAALYADVQRYESFGSHRYGSPGADRALTWIAEELEHAGLSVSSQRFSLGRQYDV